MKIVYVVFLLLLSIKVCAKPVHLQGSVVDAQTGKAVAGATISIPAKNFFYPADNDGKFDIDDDRPADTDTLNISCVGYQTEKISVRTFVSSLIIRLRPFTTTLREVSIGYKLINVGSRLKSSSGAASYLPGMEAAMFMAGSANVTGVIKTVGFYLGNGGNILVKGHGEVTAPFRIRIYGVDTNGMPGLELTNAIIVVCAKKNKQWFDVDISGYQVENPQTGFYVAFGLLDRTYYKANAAYKNYPAIVKSSEDLLTPHLGLSQKEFKEPLSYMGFNSRGRFKWKKDSSGNNYMIRAVIASN